MLVNPSKRQVRPAEPESAPLDGAALLAALRSAPAAGDRRSAARALSACPETVSDLCTRLGEESDPSVRSAILTTLIRLRSVDVVRGLVVHLRSDDAALRNEVIEAIQDMPDAALPALEDLLDDDDSDVRIFAVNIIGVLPHRRATEVLARVIAADPHVNVCTAALDGLMETGDEKVLEAVAGLTGRFADRPFVAFAVAMTLKRLGSGS
jgi:HEAT repeat protein